MPKIPFIIIPIEIAILAFIIYFQYKKKNPDKKKILVARLWLGAGLLYAIVLILVAEFFPPI